MEDRRIFARIDAKFPVRFLDPSNGREGRGDTIDISANGIGLLTSDSLPVSTPLEIWLEIPDHHDPLYTRGEVVWSGPADKAHQHRLGVHLEKAELMGLARIMWMRRVSAPLYMQ